MPYIFLLYVYIKTSLLHAFSGHVSVHHSCTYTFKSNPSGSWLCPTESENITVLNKGPVFSAEEELGQIWPWLFTAQARGKRRHCESLFSMQSFVICEELTLNSHLGEHQRQLHHCKTFGAWFNLKTEGSLLPWKMRIDLKNLAHRQLVSLNKDIIAWRSPEIC